MKNKCINIARNSKNSVMFVTLRKNILLNAGQMLAFCLRAFFMPVSFVVLKYKYLCTPVPVVNAPEAFDSSLSSGKGTGIFLFNRYANSTIISTCHRKRYMQSVCRRNRLSTLIYSYSQSSRGPYPVQKEPYYRCVQYCRPLHYDGRDIFQ